MNRRPKEDLGPFIPSPIISETPLFDDCSLEDLMKKLQVAQKALGYYANKMYIGETARQALETIRNQ